MALPNIYPGWLPYGSDDDSILFQHSLCEEILPADTPLTSVAYYGDGVDDGGSGLGRPTHHPTKGMLSKNASGTIATRLLGLTDHTKLDRGGQIYLEIAKEYLCTSEVDSEGWLIASGSEYVIAPSTGGIVALLQHATGGTLASSIGSQSQNIVIGEQGLSSTARQHSASYEDQEYVSVHIGWHAGFEGGPTFFGFDNFASHRSANGRSDVWSAKFSSIFLGGTNLAGSKMHDIYTGDAYIRNLQISSRPPMFPVHPTLRKVLFYGDSFVADEYTNVPLMNNTFCHSIMRPLAQQGVFMGEIDQAARSGFPYSPVNSDAGKCLEEEIPTYLVSADPTVVFLRGGTNDANSSAEVADFERSLQATLEKVFGLNGEDATNVEKCVVANVPTKRMLDVAYDTDAGSFKEWVASINLVFDGIVAWFDTTYPARAGDLAVAECYHAVGGEDLDRIIFRGQVGDGATYPNDIHPASLGNRIMGKAYADALLTIL